MTELLNQNPDVAESSLLHRIYTAVIVALAAILVALALFRPKATEVQVNASLNLKQEVAGEIEPVSVSALQTEVRKHKVVRKLLSGISPDILGKVGNIENSWWVDSVAQSLSITSTGPESATDGTQLVLSSKGENESFQLAVLGQLQEYFETKYHQPTGSGNPQTENRTRENVAITVQQLDEVQDELKTFTDAQIEQARENYRSEIRAVVHKFVRARRIPGESIASNGRRNRKMPVVAAVNPEWEAIEAELEKLRDNEADKNLWSVRPDSKQFHEAVDDIADRIKTTPQTVVVANGMIENPFVKRKRAKQQRAAQQSAEEDGRITKLDELAIDDLIDIAMGNRDSNKTNAVAGIGAEVDSVAGIGNPTATTTPQPESRKKSRAIIRASQALVKIAPFDELAARRAIEKEPKFRELVSRFTAARDARDTALESLSQQSPEKASVVSVVSNLKTPTVANRRSTFSRSFLTRLLAPGLMLGLLCGLMTTSPKPPETFISPEDAENWLDFPVVGTISTTDGPAIPSPNPPTSPGYVQMLRRIAEGIVCLSLVAILYAVVSINGFGKEFIGNPLGGFTNAVDHISSWVS